MYNAFFFTPSASDEDIAPPSSPSTTNTELSNKQTRYIGFTSAGIRALMYQLTSIYLRTPLKLFRPQRVDYMAVTRLYVHGSLNGSHQTRKWSFWRDSSIATLITAVRRYGWRFIPERVLPPLVANSATGMVLYTTYLASLQYLNDGKTNFLENPSSWDTFRSGFFAGVVQSLTAAPIDAIYARSTANEILKGKHTNLWTFAREKLKEIGVGGVFAGYGLSFVKESVGFAFYFCFFETIKNQWFHQVRDNYIGLRWYYDSIVHGSSSEYDEYKKKFQEEHRFRILRTSFIFTAGIIASLTLQIIQYPFTKLQNIHYSRLEALDVFNHRDLKSGDRRKIFDLYYNTYMNTLDYVIYIRSQSNLSWVDWCYKGFKRHAMSTIPATTLGLLTLEVLRGWLASEVEDELKLLE